MEDLSKSKVLDTEQWKSETSIIHFMKINGNDENNTKYYFRFKLLTNTKFSSSLRNLLNKEKIYSLEFKQVAIKDMETIERHINYKEKIQRRLFICCLPIIGLSMTLNLRFISKRIRGYGGLLALLMLWQIGDKYCDQRANPELIKIMNKYSNNYILLEENKWKYSFM